MNGPIKFTGESYPGTRLDKSGRRAGTTIFRTNYGDLSFNELAPISGIKPNTLRTRLQRYGLNSELVFSDEPLPQGHEQGGSVFKERRWDRKKCRRDGINCTKYSECQLQRCGVGPKFVRPENTDTCYVAPRIIRNLYPSALAAMSHFGVVGY